jgi:hypothetical protein
MTPENIRNVLFIFVTFIDQLKLNHFEKLVIL